MTVRTVKVAGSEALAVLEARRASYPATGEYPFLIGDAKELEQITAAAEFNPQDPDEIISESLRVNLGEWTAERLAAAQEYEVSIEDWLGKWPGEINEKGSISLHTDIVTGKVKKEVYLGIAELKEPWHLPAVLAHGTSVPRPRFIALSIACGKPDSARRSPACRATSLSVP